MAIQSSVNGLMQQLYTMGAISAGLREQKKQTQAAVASAPSFEERYRKAYNIDEKTPLKFNQMLAVKYGERMQKKGKFLEPSDAAKWVEHISLGDSTSLLGSKREIPRVKNEIASDLARASVEARTASINQTKSNFDEHVASLIRYYGKGSGNP